MFSDLMFYSLKTYKHVKNPESQHLHNSFKNSKTKRILNTSIILSKIQKPKEFSTPP
jgi:hypothetical protein